MSLTNPSEQEKAELRKRLLENLGKPNVVEPELVPEEKRKMGRPSLGIALKDRSVKLAACALRVVETKKGFNLSSYLRELMEADLKAKGTWPEDCE